jgi:hypothetical protein
VVQQAAASPGGGGDDEGASGLWGLSKPEVLVQPDAASWHCHY